MHIKEKEKRKEKKERRIWWLGSSTKTASEPAGKEDSILKSAVGRWWAVVFMPGVKCELND